jgi:hypothetical protein
MNELDYMRQSLAELSDRLEKPLQQYGNDPAYSNDQLYRDLSAIVYTVNGPNDAGSKGGKGYYCTRSQRTRWLTSRTARSSGRSTRPGACGETACRPRCFGMSELDQIQFLLGHVSIQTTERYLG